MIAEELGYGAVGLVPAAAAAVAAAMLLPARRATAQR
jgi:hypothetical protein